MIYASPDPTHSYTPNTETMTIRLHGQRLVRDSTEGESRPGVTHEEEIGTMYQGYIRIGVTAFDADELEALAEVIRHFALSKRGDSLT